MHFNVIKVATVAIYSSGRNEIHPNPSSQPKVKDCIDVDIVRLSCVCAW